jgi:hypothetical protein
MGEPTSGHALVPRSEHIGPVEGTGGTETSKYPEEEKVNNESLSSGERNGISPNLCGVKALQRCHRGVVGPIRPGARPVRELQSRRLVELSGKSGQRR